MTPSAKLLGLALKVDKNCVQDAKAVYHRREGFDRSERYYRGHAVAWTEFPEAQFRWPLVSVAVGAEPEKAERETTSKGLVIVPSEWCVREGNLCWRDAAADARCYGDRWYLADQSGSALYFTPNIIRAAYDALHAVPRTITVRITWSPEHDAQAEEVGT